jgi:hypothetical protein
MNTRHIVSIALAAVAGVATVAGLSSPALAAAPSTAGRVLTLSPAHPDPSSAAGSSYFVHGVSPGTAWTGEVLVSNTNPTAIDAWVDPVDGITSTRTGAVYTARTAQAVGAAAWLKPSLRSVTIAAHTTTTVSFTVTVPLGTSAGDHLGGLAFESKQGSTSDGAVAITTVLRSVIAVQVTVPGPAEFQLHMYAATVAAVSTTGTSGIAVDMADAGGLLGKPQLEIVLDGPAGYHRAQTVKLDTMLPGDRISDELLWPDTLAPGDYHLSITEDGGGRHGTPFVTTARLATALLPVVPGKAAVVSPQSNSRTPDRLLIGAAVAVAALLVLIVVMVARARRRRCLHCQRSLRRRSLVAMTRLDEIGGCMSCAVKVHNADGASLCRACLRTHLRPRDEPARRRAAA